MKKFDLSSSALHVIAMIFMLCDHLWATLIPGNQWLTCLGRLAFPMFAYMAVEGYFHTGNLKRYVLRLLLFAVISEIPFNLMYSSNLIYPFHQNVLWTLLLGIGLIQVNEHVAKKGKLWLRFAIGCVTVLLGWVIGMLTMVDYYGFGVVTILVFYFFRKRTWWCLLAQIAALYYLNVEALEGFYFEVNIMGKNIPIVQQGLALFALIPIWLYRGRKGYNRKWFQYACYGFYPLHMLLLYLLRSF